MKCFRNDEDQVCLYRCNHAYPPQNVLQKFYFYQLLKLNNDILHILYQQRNKLIVI